MSKVIHVFGLVVEIHIAIENEKEWQINHIIQKAEPLVPPNYSGVYLKIERIKALRKLPVDMFPIWAVPHNEANPEFGCIHLVDAKNFVDKFWAN